MSISEVEKLRPFVMKCYRYMMIIERKTCSQYFGFLDKRKGYKGTMVTADMSVSDSFAVVSKLQPSVSWNYL